jgi:hypothetical protein
LRNDYSPLLIVLLLGGFLVLLRILPAAFGWLWARINSYIDRRRVPLRFRPRIDQRLLPVLRRPRIGRGWVSVAVVVTGIAVCLGGFLVILLFSGNLLARFLALDPAVWPETRGDELKALQQALGHGRRVPVERFMTWVDLSYPSPESGADSEGVDIARYRDLGFQLIRSRVVIANAACHASERTSAARPPEARPGAMLPDGAHGFARLGSPVIWLLREVENLSGFARKSLCAAFPSESPASSQQASAAGGPARRALLDASDPIHIPVVQNDFAAAYLIGRHGVGAAALLMSMQGAFLLVLAYGYRRLRQTSDADSADGVVRHLLAVLIAGAGVLFLLHWTISWSNALGLLPVMGQPMTFLSYGISHHQFMALPCLVTIVLALRYTGYRVRTLSRRSPPPYR